MNKKNNTAIIEVEKENKYEDEENTTVKEKMPEINSPEPEISSSEEAYDKIHSNIDGQTQIIDDFFYEFDRHNHSNDKLDSRKDMQ